MGFIINKQIIDKYHKFIIDNNIYALGGLINDIAIDITIESHDITDSEGNIILRKWKAKYFTFLGLYNDYCAQIEVNESGSPHNICITGMGWRNKPNKNRRIEKKWVKKYGQIYCYLCVNLCVKGDLTFSN